MNIRHPSLRVPKRKRQLKLGPAFFVLIGVVGSLFLATIVFQQTRMARSSFVEPSPLPSFAMFLPQGAVLSDAVLEIPDLPQPSYLFGYAQDGAARVGFLTWNKDRNQYLFSASPKLLSDDMKIEMVTRLSTQSLGESGTSIILAEGPLTDGAMGVFVLLRQGNDLRFVSAVGPQGIAQPAFFIRSTEAKHVDELRFEDVNADGRLEAVAVRKVLRKNVVLSEIDSIYRWQDGQLVYDKDLSWAITTSKSLFPE